METALDLSRWRDTPRGIGYRRWTIISAGVGQLLRTRFFKILLGVAWTAGLMIAVAGFVFSQSIASGGWLEQFAAKFGPRAEAVVAAFGGFVLLYADVCVRAVFTGIFWLHSFVGLWLSLLALSGLVPQLIARDRASNALTIYLSRPLTSTDYLLGKLGTIFGVLVLLWTGPLICGWGLSVLLAPDRDFVVYSLEPLLRALAFHGIAVVTLSAIALGVSALTRSSRAAVLSWLGLWIVLGFAAAPPPAPEWLKRSSFTHNLGEIRKATFNFDATLNEAASKVQFVNAEIARNLARDARHTVPKDTQGAVAALGVFVVLSSFVFFRKLRAE